MKILITGVARMLGSHLAGILTSKNYEVYGIDNLSVGKKNNLEIKNIKKFKFFKLDIRRRKPSLSLAKKYLAITPKYQLRKQSEC